MKVYELITELSKCSADAEVNGVYIDSTVQ